jgi:hypothetical protein
MSGERKESVRYNGYVLNGTEAKKEVNNYYVRNS